MDPADIDTLDPLCVTQEIQEYRLTYPVGPLITSGLPDGSCIGDDMRKKGRNTTRLGSIQANGAGGPPSSLVDGWCEAISDLLLDVFCICETRLAPTWKHSMIENLFQQRGYMVVSHNREWNEAHPDYSSNSSGILIGVPLSSPGGLTRVDRDTYGRALAACTPFGLDSTLRFVWIYGPSGATSQEFIFNYHGILEE